MCTYVRESVCTEREQRREAVKLNSNNNITARFGDTHRVNNRPAPRSIKENVHSSLPVILSFRCTVKATIGCETHPEHAHDELPVQRSRHPEDNYDVITSITAPTLAAARVPKHGAVDEIQGLD